MKVGKLKVTMKIINACYCIENKYELNLDAIVADKYMQKKFGAERFDELKGDYYFSPRGIVLYINNLKIVLTRNGYIRCNSAGITEEEMEARMNLLGRYLNKFAIEKN